MRGPERKFQIGFEAIILATWAGSRLAGVQNENSRLDLKLDDAQVQVADDARVQNENSRLDLKQEINQSNRRRK